MTTLPQPPPNAPAPPPSEAAILSQTKWRTLWIVGVLSILALLLAVPTTIRCPKKATQTEAVCNARMLGFALFEFRDNYGTFPDADPTFGTTTANDYFRQLLAAGIAPGETMFYAQIKGTHRPDNVFTKGEALKAKECAFTYFLGATKTDNPGRPLVVTPMIPGTDRFDPKPFEGKAVILKLDGSVSSFAIDKAGHVIMNGRNLMDSHHPIWDGHAPAIAWPEL